MIRPHPPWLRMKRRKTVSVTPAMGASTVAGAILTVPIVRLAGTGFLTGSAVSPWARAPAPHSPELSQNFFTVLFYLRPQNKAPTGAGAESLDLSAKIRVDPWRKELLLRRLGFSVLAAEALHTAGSVHQLLLAGEK